MYLNLPHRRLVVDDSYRLVATSPQNKLYPSSGCMLLRCPFSLSLRITCNMCPHCYNVLEL